MASVAQGQQTRQEILRVAVDLASTAGLDGLTIGGLADRLAMSKGGLFRHFGGKPQLQVATIDAAVDRFRAAVIDPAQPAPAGVARARALIDGWITSLQQPLFPGGCFFSAAAAELDGRPGPARDRLVEIMRAWQDLLVEQLDIARRTGELPDADPRQLMFRLHAYVLEANWAAQLLGDASAYERARAAVADALTPIPDR
jgi:AcrR family transcriptional regulator